MGVQAQGVLVGELCDCGLHFIQVLEREGGRQVGRVCVLGAGIRIENRARFEKVQL